MAQDQWGAKGSVAAIDKQWKIIFHNEFLDEYGAWSEIVQDAVLSSLGKLRVFGPSLG